MADVNARSEVPVHVIVFERRVKLLLQFSPRGPALGYEEICDDARKIVWLIRIVIDRNSYAALMGSDDAIHDPLVVPEMLGESTALDNL